ncbi:MAG TPA: ABC transporter ATP-binding protein [Candidatus Acidoferrales bacterium]|nr:ABC transporter ATP-binding protein [Candidatus Acidoferrales bacterium]
MEKRVSVTAAGTAADASPAIHTTGLSKVYGRKTALASLSMTVPRGEVFGFLGPNGAGKTTAVKLLLGLVRETSGEAWILGKAPSDPGSRRHVGYLPELFRYQAWLSAAEVLRVHCELAGLDRPTWVEEIRAVLAIVDLGARANDRVGTFSKGMQQRLGLAVALLGSPQLVLLDEPTSALDPVGRHDVRQIIRQLRDRGTSVFLNSHLLTEVEMVCDRVAMVDHGRVISTGTLNDLLAEGDCRFRVSGLNPAERAGLAPTGDQDDDGEWITIHHLDPELIPTTVERIVAMGGRIYAVEPRRQSLEEHFLQLLGEL